MRSKQQPRPSFRWPQQRGDNLTGKYPYVTSHARTHARILFFILHPALLTSRRDTASLRVPRSGILLYRSGKKRDRSAINRSCRTRSHLKILVLDGSLLVFAEHMVSRFCRIILKLTRIFFLPLPFFFLVVFGVQARLPEYLNRFCVFPLESMESIMDYEPLRIKNNIIMAEIQISNNLGNRG